MTGDLAEFQEGMAVTARYPFIPSFFMATAMLIEPGLVIKTMVKSPWLAAKLLHYPTGKVPGMWALKTPQVAATVAAAVVASQALKPLI